MENINGKYQPPLMLLCATMGLAVSVSLCFAQGNREAQVVTTPPEITTPFACDSLDPEVCFDIYQRRMERIPPQFKTNARGYYKLHFPAAPGLLGNPLFIPDHAVGLADDQGDNGVIAAWRRPELCLGTPRFGFGTPLKTPNTFGTPRPREMLTDYCSLSATRIR